MPRVEICPYAAAEVALAAVAQASASAEMACICRHADSFDLTVFEMLIERVVGRSLYLSWGFLRFTGIGEYCTSSLSVEEGRDCHHCMPVYLPAAPILCAL
jgi:hypothetical protein